MIPTKVAEEKVVDSFMKETHGLQLQTWQNILNLFSEISSRCLRQCSVNSDLPLDFDKHPQVFKLGRITEGDKGKQLSIHYSSCPCRVFASAGVGGVFHCRAVETFCGTSRPRIDSSEKQRRSVDGSPSPFETTKGVQGLRENVAQR